MTLLCFDNFVSPHYVTRMTTQRILVSDPISDKGVELLRNHPELEVDVNTGLSPEELIKIIPNYQGLIIRCWRG